MVKINKVLNLVRLCLMVIVVAVGYCQDASASLVSNVALNKPVTENIAGGPYATSPANLTDGTLTTIAAPGGYAFDYTVDLQGEYYVEVVKLYWGENGTSGVHIQSWELKAYLSDGSLVTLASGGIPGVLETSVTVNANVIKLRISASSSANWIGMMELRALGAIASLAAYWKFDEGSGTTATDSSGNGQTGTLVNSPTWTTGKLGQALSYDGIDDYVDIATSNDATSPLRYILRGGSNAQSFTTTLWFRQNGCSKDMYLIGRVGWTNGLDGLCNQLRYTLYRPDDTYEQITKTIEQNRWYFAAATYDKASEIMNLYVDGILIGSKTIGSSLRDNNYPVQIGGQSGASWYFHQGLIDEVRIYGQALNRDEIKKEYEKGQGLAAYWKFDEGIGTTATDSSGNGQTGTLVNSPTWTTGKLGQALSYDGINDYVDIATSNDATSPLRYILRGGSNAQSFTTTLWFRQNGCPNNMYLIGRVGWTNGLDGICNQLRYTLHRPGGTYEQITKTIEQNRWYFATATYDKASGIMNLYVDSILIDSKTIGSSLRDNGYPVQIGGQTAVSWYFHQGLIDEVRIYNQVLSPSEIKALSDGTPPISSITSPKSGSTVSGTVTIHAAVSDNLNTESVRFKVDGVDLGPKLVSSPYKVTWDTTLFANGSHTLTVVARDENGNISDTPIGNYYSNIKLIEWGWDSPTTAYTKNNIATMEQRPLDGCLLKLLVDQNPSQRFDYLVFTSTPYSLSNLQGDIDNLTTTTFNEFTEMFATAYLSMGSGPPDWFDDWTAPLGNVEILAQVAKDGNIKGVLLDTETYGPAIFSYGAQLYRDTKTFDDYKAQVRLRGQQVMQRLNIKYPGITVLYTYAFALSGSDFDLLPSFVAGMMEASDVQSRFHELGENAYGYTSECQYEDLKKLILDNGSAVQPSVSLSKFNVGYGKWLDYRGGSCSPEHPEYCWTTNVESGDLQANYHAPDTANAYSPGWQQVLTWGLTHTDKYTWIYSERPNWWTLDQLPQAYVDATQNSKNMLTDPPTSVVVTVNN